MEFNPFVDDQFFDPFRIRDNLKPNDSIISLVPPLSKRAYKALQFMRISTVGQLVEICHHDVDNLRMPNFGRKSRNEIKEAIAQLAERADLP